MNPENEIGSERDVSLSPREKLEAAIQDYLSSSEDEREGAGGFLTGWFLVMEEQNPVMGTNSFTKTTRDLQSITTTMGLITYSDAYYRAQIANNF